MWLVLLLFCGLHKSDGAKILGVVPTPSYSHQVSFHALWKQLSLRGHQVTVLTTNPINDASLVNLTEIDWSYAYDIYNRVFPSIVYDGNVLRGFYRGAYMIKNIVEAELDHIEVRRIIKDETVNFDLVMVELSYPAMFAFSERFRCPFVGLSSLDAPVDTHEVIGNPIHPSLYPDYLSPFLRPTNFFEILYSAGCYLLTKAANVFLTRPLHDGIVRRNFGKKYPSIGQLHQKLDMIFVNTNPIFHNIRPVMPNVVSFGGGRSLSPPVKIEQDLQEYLDGATDGFIYFNLGTNVKSEFLSNHTKNVIKQTFASLSYKVLWKYELDEMEDMPSNVRIMKWVPQLDVLRHKNIKVFITQGGIQSIEESVKIHVPMIAIPFFGDQFANAQKMHYMGYGIYIDANSISKDTLRRSIQEIATNPKYRKRIVEIAELLDDQLMNGVDKLVWWTEYILKYTNVDHLKTTSNEIPLYQYYYLDVFIFCIFVVYVAFRIIKIAASFVLHACVAVVEKQAQD